MRTVIDANGRKVRPCLWLENGIPGRSFASTPPGSTWDRLLLTRIMVKEQTMMLGTTFARLLWFGARVRSWWLALGLLITVPAGEAAGFRPVDLAPVIAEAAVRSNAVTSWSMLPRGAREFGGVPFRVDGLLAVTGMEDVRRGELYPVRMAGIPIDAKAARIHLLHGVDGDDKDGVPYANLIFHFANGERRTNRLAHGVQARSVMRGRKVTSETVLDSNSRLAWSSAGGDETERSPGGVRLYRTSIRNPIPEEKISRLEVVSLFSQGTPFIAGVTVAETDGADAGHNDDPVARRVVKKSLEHPDAVYHDEFVVRAMEKVTGQAAAGARAALTIRDDEGALFFGEAAADSGGVIRLPFPPQHTVGFSILVRAPGRVPVLIEGARSAGGDLRRELEVSLERGISIGGVVNDSSGKPIAGAEVLIHRVTASGPKDFVRMDYEAVKSGTDGKWTSQAVPAGASNLVFEVSHPEFRGAGFAQGTSDGNGVRAVSTADLLGGRAVMSMENALRIEGTILSQSGGAVPSASVTIIDPARPDAGPAITTDAAGKFSFVVPQPGEVSLMIQASGFKAKLQQLNVEPEVKAMQVRLAKAEPFRGRVIDQNQAPVPGARVRLDSWNGSKVLQWQAVADGQGKFVWDSAPDGNVMLYVSATNHSSTRMSFSGGSGERPFMLRKLSRVVGRVIDAETQKPIDDFMVIRGRAYNEGEPMRWERYDTTRGRRGEYSVRLTDYGSNVRLQLMVEAVGYMPAVSAEFKAAGVYTNDFVLKKARGISGVVQLADGTPVANATVALLEPGDEAYMEKPGELRRVSSGGDFQRSNARGQFQFMPKLSPHMVLVSHALGFAELRASNVMAAGTIVLQPWGRIAGKVRVGPGSQAGKTVSIQSTEWEYGFEGRSSPPLSLALKVDTDAEGNFNVDRVPPGERKASLQILVNNRSSGRGASSTHGVPVLVKPGATTEVLIGGTGRTVVGRMTVAGGDPEDVDWKRDVHTMSTILSTPPNLLGVMMTPNMTEEDRQRAYREFNERQRAFWMTEEGRAIKRKQRTYTLLFETNGTFRVDNVEPGEYQIYISLTNPDRPDNYYEHIGSANRNVSIPAAKAGEATVPFDVGPTAVQVRGIQRTGRKAPAFEVKAYDGKTLKLEDFKGRFVFLDFWATWAGARNLDAQMLKAVHETYAKDNRLVMIGMNFDAEASIGEKFAKENGFKWTQAHAGAWGQGAVFQSYGLEGLPDNVLIDPEGKIAARNLRGSNIRNTIRNKLGNPRTAPAAQP